MKKKLVKALSTVASIYTLALTLGENTLVFPAESFAAQTPAQKINLLVWGTYFSTKGPVWQSGETAMIDWGQNLTWDQASLRKAPPAIEKKFDSNFSHGAKVAYVIGSHNPSVRVHRISDAFLPWQDPETCVLLKDDFFNRALRVAGYAELPNCRTAMKAGIARVKRFIKNENIRLVNISHGTAWNGFRSGYATRNPRLLAQTYPKVDYDTIHRYVYENFMAIGELVEPLFTENPQTLFVVASGNNGDDIDRELPMQWRMEKFRYFPVPTWYSSFAGKLDNVVAVAASEDGDKIWGGSDIGMAADFAHRTGSIPVPNVQGTMSPFKGTSGAAAETTRLFARALALLSSAGVSVENFPAGRFLKNFARQVATVKPGMQGKVWSGGILEEERFLQKWSAWIAQQTATQGAFSEQYISSHKLHVIKKVRHADAFRLAPEAGNGKAQSCETVRVDRKNNDMVWASFPNVNAIVRFDARKGERKDYLLQPRPGSQRFTGPDGLTIAEDGRVWYGEYQKNALGMINPKTDLVRSFGQNQGNVAIVAAGGTPERIWSTNHQSLHVYEFNPRRNKFAKTWKLSLANKHHEWPRDVRADSKNQVYVTAGGFFNGALIRIDTNTGKIYDYPLRLHEEHDVMALWLALDPKGRYVYISAERAGFYVFDKWTEKLTNYQRADGRDWQNYWAVAVREDGKVAFGNSAKDDYLAIDVFDPARPDEIVSYQIPDQSGFFKEAMDFDAKGRLWYCLTYSEIVGRLAID